MKLLGGSLGGQIILTSVFFLIAITLEALAATPHAMPADFQYRPFAKAS